MEENKNGHPSFTLLLGRDADATQNIDEKLLK